MGKLKVLNKVCPKCGGTLYVQPGMVLTTCPPQYSCYCEKCNNNVSYFTSELDLEYEEIKITSVFSKPIYEKIPNNLFIDLNNIDDIIITVNGQEYSLDKEKLVNFLMLFKI